uniref:Uncharacterized protein n=1 Tax=uncultured marine virus TaxID=186617 RepID=S4TFC0_9VIRU|nr:hypothetical protein [uncultured marine virus]AGA18376.1 hypothetical protein [uncultured marine virus]
MMARRQRMLRPTPRRKRVWADTYFEDLGFAESSLRSQDLLSDFVSAGGSTQGVTVARTVVQLLWGINETHAPGDRITFGLIKGTQATADVADPEAEPYADWAWNECRYSGWEHGLVSADASERWLLDTKSMRKIDEVGETWWLIYKGTAPVTAATYDVRCHVRTLLLLP